MPKKKLTFSEQVDKDHYRMGILDERVRVLTIIKGHMPDVKGSPWTESDDQKDNLLTFISGQIQNGERAVVIDFRERTRILNILKSKKAEYDKIWQSPGSGEEPAKADILSEFLTDLIREI